MRCKGGVFCKLSSLFSTISLFLLFHYFYYSTILHSDALLMTTGGGRQAYRALVLTCMLGNYTQVQVEVEAHTYMLDN